MRSFRLLNEGRGIEENVPRALELLEDAARVRNHHAQFHLGVMYEYGRGVPQNFSRAAELYEMAASDGIPDASYYLGLLHAQGRGRPQSFATAMELFQRAAERFEHAQSMYALGQMHANGQGTPVDYSLALGWIRKAAQRNDPRISATAEQVANELQAFLQQVEERVREQETALGTSIRVTVGAID